MKRSTSPARRDRHSNAASPPTRIPDKKDFGTMDERKAQRPKNDATGEPLANGADTAPRSA